MADPFGIVAVSITSLKVAKGIHDLIIHLQDAPYELLALSNETSNLKFVLDSTQELIREGGEAGIAKYDKFGPLLFQARVKLDQLDGFLAKWGKLSPWGDSFSVKKLDRLFWMKERKYGNYRATQVSGKIAAETGGFRRRFKPPFPQDACERGADVKAQSKKGSTPLHQAVLGSHLEVVQWLLGLNVDVLALE